MAVVVRRTQVFNGCATMAASTTTRGEPRRWECGPPRMAEAVAAP